MTDANVRGDQRFGFRDAKLSLSISSFTSSSLPPMNVNDIAWLLCTKTSEVWRMVSVPRGLVKSPRNSFTFPTDSSWASSAA
jgi:hypothetical protein